MAKKQEQINEGLLYVFLQSALRMRREQKARPPDRKRIWVEEVRFDELLDTLIQDIDKKRPDTDDVIRKIEEHYRESMKRLLT